MPPSFDLAHVAYRIQYIPRQETPQIDQENKPAAPTTLSATPGERIVTLRLTPGGPLGPTDFVELFASITTSRTDAQRIAFGSITEFTHDLPSGGTRWYWTRIRREVDGPDIFSDWFPESATGGLVAAALDFVGELPSHTGVFLDTFEHQDYARFYNLRAGTPTVTYPTNGETGGHVIRFQNYGWIAWKKNIAYDPIALYMMTVRARMHTAATAGANDSLYAGVEGVAADGTTLINISGANDSGSQHYFCAAGFDLGAGAATGTWQTFRGYLSGLSASPSPTPAPSITDPCEAYSTGATVVKYMRPLVILNYNGGDGIAEVDYIRIDRVVVTNGIGPNAATEVFSTSDAGPLTVTLTAPATQIANQQVKFVTVTLTEEATVEVTANYRAGISTTGTFEMYSFLYRSIGAAIVASTERIYKSALVYEPFAGIATFTASAGTYRFGIGCTIELGNGVNNVVATFRDINLRVTVVKR